MQIRLNGTSREVAAEHPTLEDLIEQFPPPHRAYAVEVNRQMVPRREHGHYKLKEGDQVEIVTLVGGG